MNIKSSIFQNKAIIFATALIMALLLSACGESFVYQKSHDIPNEAWTYDHTLNYSTNIADTNRIYNIYLDITHHTDYPKQNLYVQFHTQFPNGVKIKEQASFDLSNKLGIWNGDCSGDYCRLRIPIQTEAFFSQAGEYTFTIEQFMRLNPLKGIQSVAFLLQETEQTKPKQ